VTLKKHFILILAALCILFSACTLGGLSDEQLEGTAHNISSTWIALTLTALPTNTALPTDTSEPTSTSTPEPSPSPSETGTDLPTTGPTFVPTWTPYGQSDPGAFEEAKSDKADLNAPLLLDNQSGEDVHFTLLTPYYQEYEFGKNMTLILPEGTYTFRAKVDKNSYSGSFAITNGDKHVLTFYTNKYHFSTP
jgi:hypothetical protein